jgi:hypothetical protein
MPVPIYLSTIGVHLKYAVETTAGTRPTAASAYTDLQGVKNIPSMNPSPDTLETTTLNETEYKTYIPGLKDLGGALSFTFNLSQQLKTDWDTLVTSYQTGKAANKATWFLVDIPGITEGLYFKGEPSAMGLPEMSVNSVAEIENSITPLAAPIWAAKPTT